MFTLNDKLAFADAIATIRDLAFRLWCCQIKRQSGICSTFFDSL